MSNGKDKKQASHMTVKIIQATEQAKEMTARYIRALYGVSLLEFARQMEKAQV
jgi:hypothetical protein